MIALDAEAERELSLYRRRVRDSLRGTSRIDVDEVESSVLEHVDAALEGHEPPVTLGELRLVLEELGAPEEWASAVAPAWWRRSLSRFSTGPGDWRLAYLCFGSLALGALALPWIGPVGLVLSYLLARAAVAFSSERSEMLGVRRWLVYPSLIVLALPAAVLLILWPLLPAIALAASDELLTGLSAGVQGKLQPLVRTAILVPTALGVWWLLLGSVTFFAHRLLMWAFFPLANWLGRRHGARLAWLGLALSLVGTTVLFIK